MISTGIATQQKQERCSLNGKHPLNGARYGDGPVTMALKTLVEAYPETPRSCAAKSSTR